MKFTSFVLSVLLVFSSVLSVPVFAADSDSISYSFNGDVTNSFPDYIDTNLDNYYIKEYAEGEKGLCLNLVSKKKNVNVPFDISGSFTVSFDLVRTGAVEGTVNIVSASSDIPIIKISSPAKLHSYNGKEIGGIGDKRVTNVLVAVNTADRLIDTYINGSLIVNDAYYPQISANTVFTKLKFVLSTSQENSELVIDNINIHSGLEPKKSYPVAAYNNEETELNLKVIDMNAPIHNYNFGTTGGPANSIDQKTDIVSAELENEEENNYALHMSASDTGGGGYIKFDASSEEYDNLIYEIKVKPVTKAAKSNLILMRSTGTNPRWIYILRILDGGILGLGNDKTPIYELPLGEWTNIRLYFDLLNKKVTSIEINGDEAVKNHSYANDIGNLPLQQFNLAVSKSEREDERSDFYVDDVVIYPGTEVKEFKEEIIDVMPLDSVIKESPIPESLMQGKVGVHLRSGVIYADGKKWELNPAPYVEDGRTQMPVRAISEAFNINVDYDEATEVVTVGSNASMQIGSNILKVNGKEIEMDTTAVTKDGRTFIPLRALCEEVLGKNVLYDNDAKYNGGMIIIGDEDLTGLITNDNRQLVNDYLFFLRPDENYILEEYKNSKNYGKHPRIYIDETEVARIKRDIETYPFMKQIADNVIARADRLLQRNAPKYGTYDGVRMDSNPAKNAAILGFVYQITGDSKYADGAWVQMEALAKFPNWNPSHYLDTAEIAGHLGLAYDWVYNYLTDEQRKIVEEGIYKNGIYESLLWQHGQKGSATRWIINENNWCSVCNSNLFLAAMAMMDVYPEESARMLSINIRALEFTLPFFAPDGAWEEGPSYLEYFSNYLIRGVDSLEKMYGTDFSLTDGQGMDRIGDFLIYAMMPQDGYFNFGDADPDDTYPAEMFYFANKYDKKGMAAAVMESYKNSSEYQALVWLDPTLSPQNIDYPLDGYLRDTELVSMRERFNDEAAAYAAFQGGYTNAPHGDMDTGAFIYGFSGTRFATDFGKDSYTANGYFETDGPRWQFFRKRAEGHNTVIIDPDNTGIDHVIESFSTVESLKSSDTSAISILDMTPVHGNKTSSHRRGFMLTDERQSLVVRDEITLTKAAPLEWHMYTMADVTEENGRIVLKQDGKTVYLDMLYTGGEGKLTVGAAEAKAGRPTVSGGKSNAEYTKIELELKGSGNVTITAKLTPADGRVPTDIAMYNVPMDTWQLTGGTMPKMPSLKSIKIDGVEVENFESSVKDYTIEYIEDTPTTPVFEAEANYGRIEIIDTKTYDSPVVIRVYNEGNAAVYVDYFIHYKMIPKPTDTSGYTKYQIKSAVVTDEPQPENPMQAAFDGDMSTRWSAQGYEGVYIQLDLGEVMPVDAFFLAPYVGTTRKSMFDLEYSVDGENFIKIGDFTTSGTTNDYDKFEFALVHARYIRVNGHGNTDGDWNSYSEILIAKKEG